MPYYNANQGVLIRKGLSPQPKSIADLKKLAAVRADGHHGRRLHQEQDPPDQDARCFPQTTTIMFQQVAERPL